MKKTLFIISLVVFCFNLYIIFEFERFYYLCEQNALFGKGGLPSVCNFKYLYWIAVLMTGMISLLILAKKLSMPISIMLVLIAIIVSVLMKIYSPSVHHDNVVQEEIQWPFVKGYAFHRSILNPQG